MNSPALKILYVYFHIVYTGGVERVLTDKMNYLSRNGCEVSLVTYDQGNHPMSFPLHPNIKHIDINIRFFPLYQYPKWKRLLLTEKHTRLLKKRLQDITDEIKPDIIIGIAGDRPACHVIPKLKTDAKIIIESHSINFETINGITRERKSPLFKYYEYKSKKDISRFDALVALTQGSAGEWKNIISTVYVIPNPITYYPKEINCSPNNKRIIAVGRLDYEKGFDRLITAFSLISKFIPQWKLDIFGEGNEFHKLSSLIHDYSLTKEISIHKPTNNIYHEYMKSNLCVVSSHYEGWGLVIVEAMSCGIPCVAFNCKYGPRDIIINKENGLLAKEGDIQDLADNILWMCEHETERVKMGKAARVDSNKYTYENIMPLWLDLFASLKGK